MDQELNFSLNPVHFFALSCGCFQLLDKSHTPSFSSHTLPSTEFLTNEENFAKVAVGWSSEGIGIQIQATHTSIRPSYPSIDQGDCVELFIDTRDIKTSGFNTRFCHHFFFLPQKVEGIDKGEKTHFRTEDSHPWCESDDLECKTEVKRNRYVMKIFIPSHCLYGYDPMQFGRLGFSYRINRYGKESQHFAVVSPEYQIEQQPSLWGSLELK
jgi:hypothetical protein